MLNPKIIQNPPRAVANDSDPRWTVDNEFTFGMDPTVELLEMEARSQSPGRFWEFSNLSFLIH